MLFNSLRFLVFFPVVTALYYIVPHRWRWLLLLIASCIFYMAFIPVYILILFAIILVDYTTAFYIEQAEGVNRRLYLGISLIINIGVLVFFKYYNFFIANVDQICAACHIATHTLPYIRIILPLGLSFHTFQAMSYTIEVYRGNQKAERHFGIYALYVMFYPQLVAGPIERPQNLLPQFHTRIYFSYENLLTGLRLMMWGLFKKAVIADRVSGYVNPIFDHPVAYHNLQVLVGAVAFAVQIYCDFSGYTDIARGAAKCMGFDLMMNFNHPFQSKNVTEFWRRWHISLSTWFNDYLFAPLLIATREWDKYAVVFSLFITFFISGMWHGAGWNFIVFGLLHGLAMIYEFLTKKFRSRISKKIPLFIYSRFSQMLTLFFLVFAWIFFRAENLDKAWLMLSRIFAPDNAFYVFSEVDFFKTFSIVVSILGCMYVGIIEGMTDPSLVWFNSRVRSDIVFCSFTLFLILSFGVFQQQSFIYFQF